MRNFLLINPRYGVRHPPLGLGYLASYLSAYYPQRYQFRVVDYAFQDDRDLEAALASFRPHIVGLTATTNTFLEARRLAQFIKERLKVPIIIGGVRIDAEPCGKVSLAICDPGTEGLHIAPGKRLSTNDTSKGSKAP